MKMHYLAILIIFLISTMACNETTSDENPDLSRSIQGLTDEEVVLEPGIYDFYGTFSDNPVYADGLDTCAIPDPVSCPSVTNFCIYKLTVTEPDAYGIQNIAGCSEDPGDVNYDPECESDFWNVAVGKVYMLPFIVSDWDGGGQVTGRMDPYGGQLNALSETSMSVVRPNCLPIWQIDTWYTALNESPGSPKNTIILTIPYQNNLKPKPPRGAPEGTYDPPASTTYQAICHIENPESGDVFHEAMGSSLSGDRARLVTPHSIYRTVIGIIPTGTDVMSITTWDGTFCKRDSASESCVPDYFPCPSLDD